MFSFLLVFLLLSSFITHDSCLNRIRKLFTSTFFLAGMELEMEVSSILGDHSYVCARHFRPEDIVMYPNVCRLSASAVPSVFKNFPMNLPPQFFKKICQTVVAVDSSKSPVGCDASVEPSCEVIIDEASAPDPLDDCAQRQLISIGPLSEDDDEAATRSHSSPGESESDEDRSKLFASAVSGMSKAKMRKRLRTLELQYRRIRKKVEELEAKLERYNIGTLERDAAEQNEEAAFLLDMLRTYTEFEKTRKAILSNESKS